MKWQNEEKKWKLTLSQRRMAITTKGDVMQQKLAKTWDNSDLRRYNDIAQKIYCKIVIIGEDMIKTWSAKETTTLLNTIIVVFDYQPKQNDIKILIFFNATFQTWHMSLLFQMAWFIYPNLNLWSISNLLNVVWV